MVGTSTAPTRQALWIATGLAALVVIVFSPVRNFGFVSFDDPWFVTGNPQVLAGLSWRGVGWAITAGSEFYWHPLTWLSHMLDVQLYGLYAGGHHVTSVLLHVANTILLFLLLRKMTGATWRSACVAALFAVHPLHVESVAWIAERKDVLSTLFLLLTIWTYTWYVRRPAALRYLAVALLFALGLMAKPMLVSLPVLLLVLDLWPLERLKRREPPASVRRKGRQPDEVPPSFARLVLEKLPLLAMAVASAIATFLVQRQAGAVAPLEALPLGYRAANAVVSYLASIGTMLWPARLAAFYPYPAGMPEWWKIGGAALLITLVSIAAWRGYRRYPFILSGWLWYLVTLLPVVGLVQAGDQLMADRFTYVPLIGIAIIAVWGSAALSARWSVPRVALAAVAAAAILSCAIAARGQVWYWQDSASLWGRALEVTTGNHRAHAGLGALEAEAGRLPEAAAHVQEAVRLAPYAANYRSLLGEIYDRMGKPSEAISEYSAAVTLEPRSVPARQNLGTVLARNGQARDAATQFREALRLDPDAAEAHLGLGVALTALGQSEQAIAEFTVALRLDPDSAGAYNDLGIVLANAGRVDEAIAAFSEATRLNPSWELARFNLGVALRKAGRDRDAVKAFTEVLAINPANDAARRAIDELTRTLK